MTMKTELIADLKQAGWVYVPREVHDALCPVRVASLQDSGQLAGLLLCHFCGLGYAKLPSVQPYPLGPVGARPEAGS